MMKSLKKLWTHAESNGMVNKLKFKLYIYIYILSPASRARVDTKSIFKQFWIQFFVSQTGYHTKVKELSLPYYLTIGGERIVGLMPFPRVLALCERQTATSKF